MIAERTTTTTRTGSAGLRLVESPTTIAHRKRRVRRQRKQESRVMGVLVGVVACVTTLLGLYVNEHASLNSRNQLADKLAADNVRMEERIARLLSDEGRRKLAFPAPTPESTKAMGLIPELTPQYLRVPAAEVPK